MLDYALDLSDLKTRSWFRSSLDQGKNEKMKRVVVQAQHKITGISMKHIPFARHVRGGLPTIGFVIKSQLAGFDLKPGHTTQVRDRQGNQVTDYNWQQKNLRPRARDERSVYVLNSDELEGMIEAGGYDDQYRFIRKLKRELEGQVYQRSTELALIRFQAHDIADDKLGIGMSHKSRKKAPVWFTGVKTLEVCPKFSEKLTDNDFTFAVEAAFEDMADQREQEKQPETADVKLVEDQPQPLVNFRARVPEQVADDSYAPSYQSEEAAKSGLSPTELGNHLNSVLTSDTAMFQRSANPYDTTDYTREHNSQLSSESGFNNGMSSNAAANDKHIANSPLKMNGELHLGSSAIRQEIKNADSGSYANQERKHISRKPIRLSREIDLRNNTIKYNSAAEADDDDEDEDEDLSSASSLASSAEEEDDSEDISSETNIRYESTNDNRSRSKAASEEEDESSESSQNSSLAEEADDDDSDSDSNVEKSSLNGDYLRSRASSIAEANSNNGLSHDGGLGR